MMKAFVLLLSFTTLFSTGTPSKLLASSTPDGSSDSRPQIYMPLPVPDTHGPLTDAEKLLDAQQGRPLPALEPLQPTLDPTLPKYKYAVTTKPATLKGYYKVAASDVLPGLVHLWIAAFRKLQPGVTIDLSPPYSGSYGTTELINQTIDLVFSSRELRPQDITGFRAKFGYDPLSVPVSGGTYRQYGFLDAIAFIVNKANPLDKLTYKQLDALLSTTRVHGGAPVRTWGELGLTGEKWADRPITVQAIHPWNGFEEFVRQRVLSVPGHRGEWRPDLNWTAGGLVFPVADSVAADPYSLGYTGMAYINATAKTLAISTNGSIFYPPSYEAVALAHYPLSRLVYFNVNKAPGQPLPPALQEFLDFILSRQGQGLVRKQGLFLPLRGWQVKSSRAMAA